MVKSLGNPHLNRGLLIVAIGSTNSRQKLQQISTVMQVNLFKLDGSYTKSRFENRKKQLLVLFHPHRELYSVGPGAMARNNPPNPGTLYMDRYGCYVTNVLPFREDYSTSLAFFSYSKW